MRKRLLSILLLCCMVLTLLPTAAFAAGDVAINDTNFPDANFRQYVKNEFDKNDDDVLSADEIAAVTIIGMYDESITSIEGIEHFTALESLHLMTPNLTTLDVSKNTELTFLYCEDTKLTSLDTSHNTKLSTLECERNPSLTTLNISGNTALRVLDCRDNALAALDLTNNTALEKLQCGGDEFTTLNLSQNTNLKWFGFSNGKLSSLDLTHNTNLEELYFFGSNFSTIDVSKNTKLKILRLFDNPLMITLDTSKNSILQELDVQRNPLTSMYLGDNGSTMEVKFDNRPYPITVSTATRTFDLSQLPGFNVDKASGWTNGTVSGNILTVDANATTVTYTYDCGERQATYGTPATTGKLTMPCTLQITWENAPNALTGTVNINGAPKFGETLTANVTDTNNTGTLTYQWYRAGKTDPIGTGETYTLVQADIDKEITCKVSSSTETGTIEATVGPVEKADGPAAPVIELDFRSIDMIKVKPLGNAYEYRIDNGAWQDLHYFENLQPGKEYTITARAKETATHKPSGNSAPLKISTIGSAITEDDLAGLNIPANLVTVKCKTTGDSKAYGRIPGGFDLNNATPYMENGVLKAIVRLNLPAYLEKYDADTKKTHEYAEGEGNPHAAFTLKYVNDKWELDGDFPNVVILVKCDGQHPQTPPYPTEENVGGLEQVQVRVQCSTDRTQFKNYGILPGSVSIMPDPNNPSQATLTLIPSVYSTQYSTDTGITHIVDPNQTADNLKIQMRYDPAVGKWMPAGGLTPLVINVKCNNHDPQTPPYPTEENVGGLEQVQVRVQCSTDRTQFKNYGILSGGVSIVPDSNNPSQATLTLIPSVYSKQYTIDTGITHSVAPNQNTDNLKIQMRYNSAVGKWMPAGELTPLEVLVQCNNHQGQRYTITFNGNGGTLSVTSMTTIDQKLPELPTATHSGRYSFDGWYTAASGGTKITTATVFYENTTVYAHWTYIGGGGSSGGGGGYTYHTIRAISGLNGSISPSGWTSVRHGWDQTFAITPDKGYAVAKVLVDGKSVGSVKSYTFKNVTKDHTIEVVFMKANGNPQTGVFMDVPEGSYYEEAVDWAVKNGITTGTGNNYFTPDGICTRAQAVTFLWRVAGSPTPKTEAMPFEDVLNGSYYYEAVLWAVENGITVGTSATTFSPELTCSRAHIVTFLWRAANSPSAKTANPFTDVAADAYYIDAVLWAVKHKITAGTTLSTFSPDEGCTRAQIVTFLYRAHSK